MIQDDKQSQFPPVCPKCGAPMGWSSDFTLSEMGYISEDADEDQDKVVHVFHCGNCNRDAVYEDNDVQLQLLSIFNEEEADDPDYSPYTPYALNLMEQ